MNTTAEKQRHGLLKVAADYCNAIIDLQAIYPDSLSLSIDNCRRYGSVERIETFTAIIDFWYSNDRKEFEYSEYVYWLNGR